MHRTNHSTTYYSWFKIMKHYFSLILKSYSLSLSLSLSLSVKSLYAILKSFFFYWILFSQSDSVNLQNVRYTSEQTRTEEWVWYVDSSGSCVVCEENARFRDEIVDEKSNFLCFWVFEDLETSTQIKRFQKKRYASEALKVRIPVHHNFFDLATYSSIRRRWICILLI